MTCHIIPCHAACHMTWYATLHVMSLTLLIFLTIDQLNIEIIPYFACHVTCHACHACHVTCNACHVTCHAFHVSCHVMLNVLPHTLIIILTTKLRVTLVLQKVKITIFPLKDQTSVPWHFLNHSLHLNFLFGKSIFRVETKNSAPATTTQPSVRLKKWYVHFDNGFSQWYIFGRVNFFGRLSSHLSHGPFKP